MYKVVQTVSRAKNQGRKVHISDVTSVVSAWGTVCDYQTEQQYITQLFSIHGFVCRHQPPGLLENLSLKMPTWNLLLPWCCMQDWYPMKYPLIAAFTQPCISCSYEFTFTLLLIDWSSWWYDVGEIYTKRDLSNSSTRCSTSATLQSLSLCSWNAQRSPRFHSIPE